MNTQIIVEKIITDHDLKKSGDRYYGKCPKCGGSKTTDRFNIYLDGGFICRSCGFKGDVITYLRKMENLSCPDAHDRAGRVCRMASSCPVADVCRLGGNDPAAIKKAHLNRKRQRPTFKSEKKKAQLPEIIPEYPTGTWLEFFVPLVEKAHNNLLANQEQLDYLASRGLNLEAVSRFRLGWLSHQQQVAHAKIGLQVVKGEKNKLWVPDGLLIPIYHASKLHRIRIRRTLEARAKFLSNRKYVWIKGSGNLPYTIPAAMAPNGKSRGIAIVEAELDALAMAFAHQEIDVTSLGSLSAGVHPSLFKYIQQSPVALVSLDAEEKSKDAINNWLGTFRHAKCWPTLEGKDVGEYFKAGGDLHAWLELGLPTVAGSSLKPIDNSDSNCVIKQEAAASVGNQSSSQPHSASLQDTAILPDRRLNGGAGEKEILEAPTVIETTISNGKTIYLTDDMKEWKAISREEKAVFTQPEIERMQYVAKDLPDAEAISLAEAIVDIKEVFPRAYVSAVRLVV
ncbi:MAG: CHC2 zinc finger domain-containing protein [Desulfotalea sp.]